MKTENEKFSELKRRTGATVRQYGMGNHFDYFATFTWEPPYNSLENVQEERKRIEQLLRGWGYAYISVAAPNQDGSGWHLHMMIGGIMYALQPIDLGDYPEITVKNEGPCYLWEEAPHYRIGQHVIQKIGNHSKGAKQKAQRAEEQAKVVNYLVQNAAKAKVALKNRTDGKRIHILHTSKGLNKSKSIRYEIDGGTAWLYDNGEELAAVVIPEGVTADSLCRIYYHSKPWIGSDGVRKVRIIGESLELKMVMECYCKRKTYSLPNGKTVYVHDNKAYSWIKFRYAGNEALVKLLDRNYNWGVDRWGNKIIVYRNTSEQIRYILEQVEAVPPPLNISV